MIGTDARAPADPEAGSDWLPSWPLVLAVLLFGVMLLTPAGGGLLSDPDSQWHIAVGRWILGNRAFPTVDGFSFTRAGSPWIAKEWLSQILLALSESTAGWAGVRILASATVALTFGLLLHLLLRYLAPLPATFLTGAALVLSSPHFLARPHLIALPFSLLWVFHLVRAVEERRAPTLMVLSVMVAWANLHGGFTLGLLLVPAFALDAIIGAPDAATRRRLAKGWALFASGAVVSACITPYGYESILVTGRILSLGDALPLINEWRSPDFSSQYLQGFVLLFVLLAALVAGVRLPLAKAIIVGGLIALYFKHARNAEIFATFAPLVLAPLIAHQWPDLAPDPRRWIARGHRSGKGAIAFAWLVVLTAAFAILKDRNVGPPSYVAPAAAMKYAHQARLTGKVLNDYNYGGFLILEGVPTFIDGRGELYGGQFISAYVDAISLRGTTPLSEFLDSHAIAWTLLRRDRPANQLLDHLSGWRRLYTDENSAIFTRVDFQGKD